MGKRFVQVCGREGSKTRLALDAEGKLWTARVKPGEETDWQPVSFNENYAGYYPACTFTALVATGVDFVAAGIGEDGLPYVYRSLMGGVWESANLMAGSAWNGFVRATGKINQMLYDKKTRQIFLLCDNGELVTMPDCPKCVRVRRVTDCALVAGEIVGDNNLELILTNARGERILLNEYEMTQVRASYSYVKEQLKKGGWLIDLRGKKSVSEGEPMRGGMPGRSDVAGSLNKPMNGGLRSDLPQGISPERVISLEMDEVEDWLEEQPKETVLAFLCEYGTQADEAAHYARRQHFSRAYSLGGAGELLHVE